MRDVLTRAAAGSDLSGDFDPVAGYRFDPLDARDLAAELPQGWRAAPMTLIRQGDNRGGKAYAYRIGPPGDTRSFLVTIMPSGRLLEYAVHADPDDR